MSGTNEQLYEAVDTFYETAEQMFDAVGGINTSTVYTEGAARDEHVTELEEYMEQLDDAWSQAYSQVQDDVMPAFERYDDPSEFFSMIRDVYGREAPHDDTVRREEVDPGAETLYEALALYVEAEEMVEEVAEPAVEHFDIRVPEIPASTEG